MSVTFCITLHQLSKNTCKLIIDLRVIDGRCFFILGKLIKRSETLMVLYEEDIYCISSLVDDFLCMGSNR